MTIRHSRNADSNFYWCTNPSYDEGNVHYNQDLPMTCLKCGHHTCVRHLIPWHFGKTCEAYDNDPERQQRNRKLNAERIANDTLIKKISKKCPSCGVTLQKTDGDMEDALVLQQFHDSREAVASRQDWRRWEAPEITPTDAARMEAAEATLRADMERARDLHALFGNQTNHRPPRSDQRDRRPRTMRHHHPRSPGVGAFPHTAPSFAQIGEEDTRAIAGIVRPRDDRLQASRDVEEKIARLRRAMVFWTRPELPPHWTPGGDHSPSASATNAALANLPPLSYRDRSGSGRTSPTVSGLTVGLHVESRNAPSSTRTTRNMIENDRPRSFTRALNPRRADRPLPNIGAVTIADMEA
ncbi:hypothetical protein LTR78_006681 [Recurvomyces mirabilis]|uniref:IBR domain-containing protein n=1 Tax=Recurvomyces mirabilis TaxID=574656 RepID=A0AAE1BZP9_9PEZI|nr:hypothetical protein LTR78_006681 [Recurvomyces mirabilis]KAK5151430.1 hypothetical protein LTS14_009273 [Recurvomyces mirabilis]